MYDRKKFTRDNFQIEYFKNTLTFPYPYAKCESNYIRIYTRIHRLIELSVYLVIIRSIMSTFHATSLTLFRQVRFFIRNPVMFGYLALPANYIISCSQSLKNSPWPPHKVTGTTHKTLRLWCSTPPSREEHIHSNNKSVISDVSPDRGHVHRCKYFSH